jgi:NADH-quinone oxidoreductase subunit N
MTISFASLAGLPLTAGFIGKLFVFLGLTDHGYWGALSCAVIAAAAGFYYYFKVIRAMYWQPAPEGCGEVAVSPLSKLAIGLCTLLILVLGFYPQLLIRFLP